MGSHTTPHTDELAPPGPSAKTPAKNGAEKNGRAQKEVAAELGITLEELKLWRDEELEEGVDWFDGRPVLITSSGEKKLRAALGLPELERDQEEGTNATGEGAGDGTGSQGSTPAAPPACSRPGGPQKIVAELVVIRPARGTKRVVMCTDPASGEQVWLQVKDSLNFVRGMKVPNCVKHATVHGQFIYEGRLPRWKGRF